MFFIFMMIFGNLMLLNLFLAILLKFISENQGSDAEDGEEGAQKEDGDAENKDKELKDDEHGHGKGAKDGKKGGDE